MSIALMLASPAILVGGNHAVREVPGRDFTPFEVAGPLFLLILLPVYAGLGYHGAWRAGLSLVAMYQLALVVLTFRWAGALAGIAVLVVNLAVISVVLLADRSERAGSEPAAPGGPGPPSSASGITRDEADEARDG